MIKTAHSTSPDESFAVAQLKKQFAFNPTLILFFASSHYNADALRTEMTNAFPNCTLVGCSTSGEIISGHMLDHSIVASAFDEDAIETFYVAAIEDVRKPNVFRSAIENASKHFGETLNFEKHVGIILTDGLGGSEEYVMDKLGDATEITIIGGSTGDDLKFKQTSIFHNDKVNHTGTLLLVIKPKNGFSTLKTQSFKPTGKILRVTKGIEAERKILEFNNKPAAQAYAEALGIPVDQLSQKMFYSPLGLMDGDEPYVRSPRVVEGDSVSFFCSVKEGQDLMVLASTNIVEDTARVLAEKEKSDPIKFIINFNCILRTLDLKQQKKTDAYGELFAKYPTIGFSTYGESYIGHINQTATMLFLH